MVPHFIRLFCTGFYRLPRVHYANIRWYNTSIHRQSWTVIVPSISGAHHRQSVKTHLMNYQHYDKHKDDDQHSETKNTELLTVSMAALGLVLCDSRTRKKGMAQNGTMSLNYHYIENR